jgi:hypothetical protein
MSLKNNFVFAKLQVDLHPGLLSRLVTFNWAHQPEHAILEALATAEDAMMTHAHHLVAHGESVYNNIIFLESTTVDISSLLATEVAIAKWEKEEINAWVSNIFGMHHGAVTIWTIALFLSIVPFAHCAVLHCSDFSLFHKHEAPFSFSHLIVPPRLLCFPLLFPDRMRLCLPLYIQCLPKPSSPT